MNQVQVATLGIAAALAALPLAARQPNIVFILADDLGYGGLGCYGQKRYLTPEIDRLAAEGMRFTQHYAASVCAPSRSALMTGMHTGHTPIRTLGGFKTLAAEDVTVAEVLKTVGYATGCFGKWGMGYDEGNPGNPTRQGFDEFFGQLHHIHAHFYYPFFLWKNEERFPLPENEGHRRIRYSEDEIQRQALDFIRRRHDQPFFAYVAYSIPHFELTVPEDSLAPYRGRWEKVALPGLKDGYIDSPDSFAAFAGMMSRLDRHVGELLDLLRELGIEQDTIVVFSSDNGPQAGTWKPVADFFRGAGPLRGYKSDFYEGGIRVPFIARWPGRIPAGTTSDLVSAFWDFLPTAAELAGAEAPAVDGISMVPTLLQNGVQKKHDFLYWEYPQHNLAPPEAGSFHGYRAVRMGDWKAVQPRPDAPFELYNLAADPGENQDLAVSHGELMRRIHDCIARAARTEPRAFPEQPRPTVADYVR